MSFLCGSAGKESPCSAGDLGLIPGLGRSPGEKEKLLTPVFWPGEFHGLCSLWVTKSHRQLSDFQFYFSSKCTVYVVGSVLIRDKKHDI